MNKPSFICIGAAKSGTTSLYEYLKANKSIFLPEKKELHFFSRESLLKKMNGPGDLFALDGCPKNYTEYLKVYSNANDNLVCGDISPSYFSHISSLINVKDKLPDVKIILMLRNPIDKSFSQYMHLVREGRETKSFTDALMQEEVRSDKGYSDFWSYKEQSFYSYKVSFIQDLFGKENVIIIFTEDLRDNGESTLNSIFDFLGVPRVKVKTNEVYNKSGVPKNRIIAKLVSPGWFLRIMKMIIPYSIGVKIKSKISNVNTGKKLPISVSEKDMLKGVFKDDVCDLENMINVKVPWDDFK